MMDPAQPLLGREALVRLCHNDAAVRARITREYDRYLQIKYHDGESPKEAYVPWANVAVIELEG